MTNTNPFPQKAMFSFKNTKTEQSLSPFYSPPHSSIVFESFCVLPVQNKLDYIWKSEDLDYILPLVHRIKTLKPVNYNK